MNKLRSNLSLSKQTAKLNVKPSVTVNQSIVTSFDAQCAIDKEQNNFPVAQHVKKKRTALENISNASGTNSNANSISANKDAAKKSRFGNNAFGVTGNAVGVVKKAESVKKISKDAQSSKENANVMFAAPAIKKEPLQSKSVETAPLRHKPSVQPVKVEKPLDREQVEAPAVVKSEPVSVERKHSLKTSISLQDEKLISTIEKITRVSGQALPEMDAERVVGWEDIDADDKDEFSSSDYVSSIFKYYRERESKFAVDDYLRRHTHLNKLMRLLLIDWMVEVQQQLEFNHEVLYLSVKLIDLYLHNRHLEKEKLQLLGGAAMFVACKFEERMPPIIDDFIFVSDNAYDRNELIKMEIEILKTVRFDIGAPLSYTFLRRYAKCIKGDMRFLTLARYILELSLQDYQFAYVSDSAKACAALYLAMKMVVKYDRHFQALGADEQKQHQPIVQMSNLTSTEWNATLVHYTSLFLRDFVEHLPALNGLIKAAPACKYKTIYKKYSHHVFYEVASIEPLTDEELDQLQVNSIDIDNRIAAKQ